MSAAALDFRRGRVTQAELLDELRRRFGDDPRQWAFECPNCHDVATAADFFAAGGTSNHFGMECIGRYLGALSGPPTKDSGRSQASRGCDWVAYGLFRGPLTVVAGDKELASFPVADAEVGS